MNLKDFHGYIQALPLPTGKTVKALPGKNWMAEGEFVEFEYGRSLQLSTNPDSNWVELYYNDLNGNHQRGRLRPGLAHCCEMAGFKFHLFGVARTAQGSAAGFAIAFERTASYSTLQPLAANQLH